MTTAAAPTTDRNVLDAFDRERGLRLARLVALVFGGLIALTTLVLLSVGLLTGAFAQSAYAAIFGACAAGVVGYALALWLVQRQLLHLSAALIVGGFIAILATIQVTHGQTAGLDGITVGLFGMYGILCALAGVLVDTRFMFSSAGLANLLSGVLCFVLPHASMGMALLVWGIVCLEEWVAVLLTFGAQTLYIQTAQELGDLRIAIERARRLDDLKNQFIRSVNHELRNPIMAWYSAAETLQLGDAYLTPEVRLTLVDQSVDIGKRVLNLLRSILDAPLLDENAKNFTPQPVAIRPVVNAALSLLDPLEGGDLVRDIHVSIAPDLTIWGDEVRLQQILVNLFSNALKYSPPGTPIEVTALPALNGTMATITVRDHGLGVPPDEQELLFERFVRLPRDLASNIVGNGLGLYLCRVLAEAMNGSIHIVSSGVACEGTAFIVELPLYATELAPVAASRSNT